MDYLNYGKSKSQPQSPAENQIEQQKDSQQLKKQSLPCQHQLAGFFATRYLIAHDKSIPIKHQHSQNNSPYQ